MKLVRLVLIALVVAAGAVAAGCGSNFGKHDLAEALEQRGYVRVTCVEAKVKNFEIECVGQTQAGDHETIYANCDADACIWYVLETSERGDVRRD